MRTILLAWLLAGALMAPGAAHALAPLTLCYEDVEQGPWTFPDGTGLNFELLHRVEAITGEHFAFISRPWQRCLEEVRTGRVDGVVGPADTPERRRFGRFPLLPNGASDPQAALYDDIVYVFLRRAGAARWDGRALRSPGAPVLVQRGYLAAELLAARGIAIYPVKSADDGLRMLAAGMADAAVLQGASARARARADAQLAQAVVLDPRPYHVFTYHLMFSRASALATPARLRAIWAAIARVRASADYRALEAARAPGVGH
jgi:polar amino acid transport system substrate-binding protein